jgi:hypothetical protein
MLDRPGVVSRIKGARRKYGFPQSRRLTFLNGLSAAPVRRPARFAVAEPKSAPHSPTAACLRSLSQMRLPMHRQVRHWQHPIIRRTLIRPRLSCCQIPGGEWHSVVFHAPAAVVPEVKAGPDESQLDKEFASWAPPDNDPAAARFVSWLETAAPGDAVSRQQSQ